MDTKRRLKGWQTGILAAILAVMLSTMFMPAFHFDSEVAGDMYTYLITSIKDNAGFFSGLLDEYIDDELTKKQKEDIDDDLKELKEEDGVDLTHLSPIRIMMHDPVELISSDDADEEDIQKIKDNKNYKKITKGYRTFRFLLIIEYGLAVVVLALVIAGFAAGWSKTVPLVFSALYGGMSAILFGYLRFRFLNAIGEKYTEIIEDTINDFGFEGLGKVTIDMSGGKLLSYLYSSAFLIAFIISMFVLVMSVISFLTGNTEEVMDYERDYGSASYSDTGKPNPDQDVTEAFESEFDSFGRVGASGMPEHKNDGEVFGESGFLDDPVPVTIAAPAMPEPVPAASIVLSQNRGKVCCTKGVAAGQGFQLPQDRKVIVGKSPSKANLTVNHPNVSNVHCSIRYNAVRNSYIVKDHSTNGTFVNGSRMPKDTAVEYPSGTVLVLADGANEITLG